MMANSIFHEARPRRERIAKSAFLIWMAAYAVIIIAIVAAHSFGSSTTIADGKGVHSLQAKAMGEPQSSISAPPVANVVLIDDKG